MFAFGKTGRSEDCRIGIGCRHFPSCRTRVVDGFLVADVVRAAPKIAPLLVVQNGFCLEVAVSGKPAVLRKDCIGVTAEHPFVRVFYRLVHCFLERVGGAENLSEHTGIVCAVFREDAVARDLVGRLVGVGRIAPTLNDICS